MSAPMVGLAAAERWRLRAAPGSVAAVVLATFDLQRFAPEDEGRTEDPTARKMGKARQKGQVAKTNELPLAVGLLVSFIGMYFYLPFAWTHLGQQLRLFLSPAMLVELTPANTNWVIMQVVWNILYISAPALIVALMTGVGSNLVQVGFLFTLEPLRPDWTKILPTWERVTNQMLFSKQVAMNFAKSIFKLTVITWLAYSEISAMLGPMINTINTGVMAGISLYLDIAYTIGLKAAMFLLVLALIDWWFQKREQKEQLQMTKQEVKEEFRDMEGDPQVKHRIRQRAREMAQMRMMEEVPQADVVITNPTHFAVALKYFSFADGERPTAPQVVAKGQDLIALRIRALAEENGVAIWEDPPLARALYADTEIGDIIPDEHFAAVATILTHVHGAKARASARARA